jgi:hypothetical protein
MSTLRLWLIALWIAFLCFSGIVLAQTESATVAGRVTDSSGAVISGAGVQLHSVERGTVTQTITNSAGIYLFPAVQPGEYHVTVRQEGFRQVDFVGLVVNVQDHIEENFRLQVGSVSESVTVSGAAPQVNTESATVSTVVDRNFAENLPLNGRSFQTLIQLTPGVVLTPSNGFDQGQFSVNGQRASSNYWMVDGVSANIGTSAGLPGNGPAGATGAYSVEGGTNSLVSIDALQEFRIQTSTFAPEFGRTPGAQISIVTRSGQNAFHGNAFDYFRNDVLDANDWFAHNKGLPKPQERQNDFGGTFSGPILKNHTFYFFSYEGLRLRLPQTRLTIVPDASFTPGGTTNSRQNAIPAIQPYLNAFPLPNPNSPEIFSTVSCDPATDSTCPPSGHKQVATGAAAFNASFSNRSALDAYSLRIDHRLSDRLSLFGRYNYSPSSRLERGSASSALSTLTPLRILTETATVGAAYTFSSTVLNDCRFNYSRVAADGSSRLDSFGGAVPLMSVPIPSPFTVANSQFVFYFSSLNSAALVAGKRANNTQHQINVIDSVAVQRGSHDFKFGIDFRRLTPVLSIGDYQQNVGFADVPSAENGTIQNANVSTATGPTLLFRNLSLFGQDTWRVTRRLTTTYGLRWDVDYTPTAIRGPSLPALTGFDLSHPSQVAIAPAGTPAFSTRYNNLAPRFGLAYQLSQDPNWGMTLRGGVGVFYDLATSDAGPLFPLNQYPFGGSKSFFGVPFPLTPTQAAPPNVVPPANGNGQITGFDPSLRQPYTLQWNVSTEQLLGGHQSLSATYIGSRGRRLTQEIFMLLLFSPNPPAIAATVVANTATSDYDGLQLKYQRQLSQRFQALASYTWSHSIDSASAGTFGNFSNLNPNPLNPTENRGPSDFDIRHAFSAGITYQLPNFRNNFLLRSVTRGWSLQSIIQAQSARPVNISDANFFGFENLFIATVHPDLVPGQPLYLTGSGFPGGKAINPAAFTDPPSDPSTGAPLRNGDVGRNFLRGFGMSQWDFAVHREFPIRESVALQFRAEMFNIFNHPNFAPPAAGLHQVGFGVANQMLGRSLDVTGGQGGLNALYQVGGPRSMQFALKLTF